jgi:hypothetical protein
MKSILVSILILISFSVFAHDLNRKDQPAGFNTASNDVTGCPNLTGTYSCLTEHTSEPPLIVKITQKINSEGFTVYENLIDGTDMSEWIADGVTRYFQEDEGDFHLKYSVKFWCENESVHVVNKGSYIQNGEPGEYSSIGRTFKNAQNEIIQIFTGTDSYSIRCTPK